MKDMLLKELMRSICSTLGRFLAIVGIIGLGCGFYAGLRMTGGDMRICADRFYDGTKLYDLRVVCGYGLSDEQLKLIRNVDGVRAAEGSFASDVMCAINGEHYVIRMMSCDMEAAKDSVADADGVVVLSDNGSYLNRLVLAVGDWPSSASECVLSADKTAGTPVEVGDTVEVLSAQAELDGVLERRTFTVSGLVHASAFPSNVSLGYTNLGSGVIQQYMYVGPEAFSEELPYTEVFVTLDEADAAFAGEAEYQQIVDGVAARIEDLHLGKNRLDELKSEAEAAYKDAEKEYEEGKQAAEEELALALTELNTGREELDDVLRAYRNGELNYEQARSQLNQARAAAERGFADAEQKIRSGEQELAAAERELSMSSADIEVAQQQLDEAAAELAQGEDEWASTRQELERASADLNTISSALSTLASIAENSDEPDESTTAQLQAQVEAALAATEDLYDMGLIDLESEELASELEALIEDIGSDVEAIDLEAEPDELLRQVRLLAPKALGRVQSLVANGNAEIAEGIAEGDARLAEARSELATARDQFERAKTARKQIDEGKSKLNTARAQLEQERSRAASSFAVAERELERAAAQLAAAEAQIEAGRRELEEGQAQYDAGRLELDSRLFDAASQLEAARADIDALEEPVLYVLDRTKNAGVASYQADSERIDAIAQVFPLIFFLVATLVSLTTMTRMVEDERIEIGTHKALGFSTARITLKYVLYASVAGLLGAVFGISILSQILPFVIQLAYDIMYNIPLPRFPLPFDFGLAALSAGIGIFVSLAATWLAAAATLRENPASLMLPRAPKPGRRVLLERITPIWSRLNFSWKVSVRNIFLHTRRLTMTLIGIAGCTALLLTGLGLHDSIWDIIDNQFEGEDPVISYNVIVGLDSDTTDAEIKEVDELLRERGGATAFAHVANMNLQIASQSRTTPLAIQCFVPEVAAELHALVDFRTREDAIPLDFNERSVVLTEKIASQLGVGVGDEIQLFEQDEIGNPIGDPRTFTVSGVCENYVYHYLYVGREMWQAVDGELPHTSSVFARVSEESEVHALISDELSEKDCVSTVAFNTEVIDSYRKSLRSVNMIVVVLVTAAAALAFIVLYNLTNIQLIERTREIASLKVLGFGRREVAAYLFRETLLLVVIASLLGLVLGTIMEGFVVVTAEVDAVMFGRTIHPTSYVLAFLFTFVFSLIVMLSLVPKLHHIDMVESLKSVE